MLLLCSHRPQPPDTGLGRFLAALAPESTRQLLEQALCVYESLGAAMDLARVDARLRALAVPRGRRGPRKRPSNGWDAPTLTERTVARLVSEGLSNLDIAERLYISRGPPAHVSPTP